MVYEILRTTYVNDYSLGTLEYLRKNCDKKKRAVDIANIGIATF